MHVCVCVCVHNNYIHTYTHIYNVCKYIAKFCGSDSRQHCWHSRIRRLAACTSVCVCVLVISAREREIDANICWYIEQYCRSMEITVDYT